jgi:hypothetical protein
MKARVAEGALVGVDGATFAAVTDWDPTAVQQRRARTKSSSEAVAVVLS